MSNFLLSIRNGLSKNSCTNVVSLDKSISEIKSNKILYSNMSNASGQNWNGLVFKARSYSLIISLNKHLQAADTCINTESERYHECETIYYITSDDRVFLQ